jgi:hypothetical protein
MVDYNLLVVREFIRTAIMNAPMGFEKAKFEIGDVTMVVSTFIVVDDPMIEVSLSEPEYGLMFVRTVKLEDMIPQFDEWAKEVSV